MLLCCSSVLPFYLSAPNPDSQDLARPSPRHNLPCLFLSAEVAHSRTTNTGPTGSTDVTSSAIRSLQPDTVLIQPIKLGVSTLAWFLQPDVTGCDGSYGDLGCALANRHRGLNIYFRASATLPVPIFCAFDTPVSLRRFASATSRRAGSSTRRHIRRSTPPQRVIEASHTTQWQTNSVS